MTKSIIKSISFVVAMSFTVAASAAEPTSKKNLCPDSMIFEKMIDGICWGCMLPLRLLGGAASIGGSSGMGVDAPDGASSSPACICWNEDANGIPNPQFGLTAGMWNPAKLMEVTTLPWCFPSLGGIDFADADADGLADNSDATGIEGAGIADALMVGGSKNKSDTDDVAFYHAHYIHFPLLAMLDAMVDSRCAQDGFFDFDIGFMSEVDLSWNDPEASAILAPDGGAFANLPAIASCAVDAVAATLTTPIDSMYWCAGSWGSNFPLNGYIQAEQSHVQTTSLLSYRMLFKMHRLGQVRESYGNEDAMCGNAALKPIPTKSGWKHSMIYPVQESDGSCCHNIGSSTFSWGEWRSYPGEGERAFVYMMWKYTECCITF